MLMDSIVGAGMRGVIAPSIVPQCTGLSYPAGPELNCKTSGDWFHAEQGRTCAEHAVGLNDISLAAEGAGRCGQFLGDYEMCM